MKKSLWFIPIISLLFFHASAFLVEEEKSLWDDYQLAKETVTSERDTPYLIEYHEEITVIEEAEMIFVVPEQEKEGLSWMAEKIKDGSHAQLIETYQYVYNQDGVLLSRSLVPDSGRYYEASEIVYEYGSTAQIGTVFALDKITKYGSDCGACNADIHGYSGTASGVATGLTSIRQSDGNWKTGITYDGYYVVASSQNIPMCTVLQISNHTFYGMGLTPGEPFQAIVLDRGVKDGILDLFVGSEYKLDIVKQEKQQNDYLAEIIAFGTWTKNSQGQRICKIEEGPH